MIFAHAIMYFCIFIYYIYNYLYSIYQFFLSRNWTKEKEIEPFHILLFLILSRSYIPNDTNGHWLHNSLYQPSMCCWDWLLFERSPMQQLHHLLRLILACLQSRSMSLIVRPGTLPFLELIMAMTVVSATVVTSAGCVMVLGKYYYY